MKNTSTIPPIYKRYFKDHKDLKWTRSGCSLSAGGAKITVLRERGSFRILMEGRCFTMFTINLRNGDVVETVRDYLAGFCPDMDIWHTFHSQLRGFLEEAYGEPAIRATHTQDQCVVCLDAATAHNIVYPCGHQIVCGECRKQCSTCPWCRC